MGCCKNSYCENKGKTIRAHLVPKCIFRQIFSDGKDFVININEGRKVQDLYFDREILCKDCDGILGTYDDIAGRFIKEIDGKIFKLYKNSDVFIPKNFYKSILSIVYRCSLSSIITEINLGPYEDLYEKIIFCDYQEKKPLVTIRRLISDSLPMSQLITYPVRFRFGSESYISFIMNGFRISIFHKAKKFPFNAVDGFIDDEKLVRIMGSPFLKCPEYRIIEKLVKETKYR